MSERVLFVASAGGHLEELSQLKSSLVGSSDSVTWVTHDCPQSRSMLAAERDVIYVGRVGSRGYLQLLRTLWPALRILRRVRPAKVYSTGSGIALAFLPIAWFVGARALYVESAARTDGPSRTGRILHSMPWIQLRTQYRRWAGGRWHYAGSVFDCYTPVPAKGPARPIQRVVVTLGTQEGYPFVSLVERMRQIVPEGVEVLWQIGADFSASQRPLGAREIVSSSELHGWVTSADVVVAHAGVGSALTLLQHGRTPVLVPRSARRGEHVDEHQQLIAQELTSRGLAVCASPADLAWDDLVLSTMTAAERRHAWFEDDGLVPVSAGAPNQTSAELIETTSVPESLYAS